MRGLKEVKHDGGLHGFLNHLKRLRDEQFTVVVLANRTPPPPNLDPGCLAQEIAQVYFYEKLDKKPTAISSVSEATLEAYTGKHDYGAAVVTVTREGNRLFAQLSGQPRFEIFPKSETKFFGR